jgi:hypothetical protein
MAKCPICSTIGASQTAIGVGDTIGWECLRCGRYRLSGTADVILPGLIDRREINASTLSHIVRCQFDGTRNARTLSERDLEPLKSAKQYIRPQEQSDALILWIGNNQGAPQDWAQATVPRLAALVGTAIDHDTNTEPGISWLFQQIEPLNLFKHTTTQNGSELKLRLTMDGWKRFDELLRRVVNSRSAFMAMKFNDVQLDTVLKTCFEPAALRAGFTLRPLNALPVAGLIDNQIRAAIRSARFVVADLTHDNNGAYFEAGFAEGLGIPVIYTCEAAKFKSHKTHFDTNHMTTIVWDAGNLDKAGSELTATIRNSLPVDSTTSD